VSAVAERLQAFRGQAVGAAVLRRPDGRVLALASFEVADEEVAVDLDDPTRLLGLALRPSLVATHDRATTQPIALRIHESGAAGFLWWSTLEASWANATLFGGRLRPLGTPSIIALDPEHPAVREAAEFLGLEIETGLIRFPTGRRPARR
jgi:hypothetical protein